MALKTLKGVEKIGGFQVFRVEWNQPAGNFIEINDAGNAITFKIQKGPIKENGVNGCQVDTLIHAAEKIIEGLNVPPHNSHENDKVLYHLREALNWLNFRRMDREKRKVEGTSAA